MLLVQLILNFLTFVMFFFSKVNQYDCYQQMSQMIEEILELDCIKQEC